MAETDLQLTIDTCNAVCAVALSSGVEDDFVCLAQDRRDLGRGHAEVLAPQVASLLAAHQHIMSDITRVAVTTGPGSFTGQRVGLSFARMLAAACDIPCVGVGVLEALLSEAGPGLRLAILDARRDAVYVAIMSPDDQLLVPPRLVPLNDLDALLSDVAPLDTAIGHGRHFLAAHGVSCACVMEQDLPTIPAIARLGAVAQVETHPAKPLYLRSADAKKQLGKSLARIGGAGRPQVVS